MGTMSTLSRHWVGALLTAALTAMMLTGCAGHTNESTPTDGNAPSSMPPSSDPTPRPGSTASAAVLLSAVETTVLGQQVTYPLEVPAQISSAIVTLPPGAQTGWHFHSTPLYAYILEGTLTVTYDSDGGPIVKSYGAGEAVLEAIGTPHNGENRSGVAVKILVVNIGADGIANTTALP